MTDSRLLGCGRCMRDKAEVWKQIPYEGGTLNLCQQCAETPGVAARLTKEAAIVTPKQEPMFKLTEKEKADLGGQLAQLECQRITKEMDFAAIRKEHKEEIDGLTEQIEKIAATINQAGDPQ